jgi:hypothetical protein
MNAGSSAIDLVFSPFDKLDRLSIVFIYFALIVEAVQRYG